MRLEEIIFFFGKEKRGEGGKNDTVKLFVDGIKTSPVTKCVRACVLLPGLLFLKAHPTLGSVGP